jgi:hypothetical protein
MEGESHVYRSRSRRDHARAGLEDNLRLDRNSLAPSNAALVHRVVDLCERYDRHVADWRTARAILGLSPALVEDAIRSPTLDRPEAEFSGF